MKRLLIFFVHISFFFGCAKQINKNMKIMSYKNYTKSKKEKRPISRIVRSILEKPKKNLLNIVERKPFKLLSLFAYLGLLRNIIIGKAHDVNATFKFKFGGPGSNAGQFTAVVGLDISESDLLLYAVDRSKRVQAFNLNGTFKFLWNISQPINESLNPSDIGLFKNLSILTNNAILNIVGVAFNKFNGNVI